MLSRTAFAGPPGPAFSFSAYLQCLSSTSLRVETHWFSPIPVRRCPRIRSQLGHTPPTGPVWGFAGVRSLTRPPKPHTGPHRGEFGFSPQNEFTPPPKGGGAGYRFSWVRSVCPARSQPGHSGPTGPVQGFGGVSSLPGCQNRTQGHTGPSLVLIAFSCCALGLAGLTSPFPACSLPPPGWDG